MPDNTQRIHQNEAELAAMVQNILALPLHAHFGLRLIERGEDWSRLAFTAGERTWTHTGRVHGGVLSLLLEPPALLAVAPSLAPGELPVTIDIHIQILRAVPPGAEVILEGRVLKRGRSVAFCASQATVAGVLCATASITKSIVAAPAPRGT